MTELNFTNEPEYEERFDFSSPEHVLIEVVEDGFNQHGYGEWKGRTIQTCAVIWSADNTVTGAASYEQSYGGFLDYTIEGMIDYPGEGWWVVENVTGYYSKGDGWMTDDNMDFYCGPVRPATPDEIAMA